MASLTDGSRPVHPATRGAEDPVVAAQKTRVAVADDDPRVLELVTAFLGKHLDVVGRAADGESLVAIVEDVSPDIAVIDISMANLTGIEAARIISRQSPQTKIIMLSIHDEPVYVQASFEAGASGYVVKATAFADLLPAIDSVIAGERYLSPQLRSGSDPLRGRR